MRLDGESRDVSVAFALAYNKNYDIIVLLVSSLIDGVRLKGEFA